MFLRIGTDCSGIEAPIEALEQLRIPYKHRWACEFDEYARKSINANYHPEIMYDDITKRDHKHLPFVDIYVCGFPCQPFSTLGKKKGTSDKRSNTMLHVIDVIKSIMPTTFILENVPNFQYIQAGKPYTYLINKLSKLKDHAGDSYAYDIQIEVLNTKHYGIPQNRSRLYIIGVKKTAKIGEYATPRRIPLAPLDTYLMSKKIQDYTPKANASKVIARRKLNLEDNNVIACAGYGNHMQDICPTITCTTPYYLTKYRRYLSSRELLLLQGFRQSFRQVVSDRQLRRQAGNSMSVNVLKVLLLELVRITEF
jgi:DNA (cytosine-5)-methyltransferase 1